MSKRRAPDEAQSKSENGGQESDEDMEMVDVDFEWFDPQEIDFRGIKTLLRQLFDVDNELFNLSALSDLIISQPLLGSTVKSSPDDNIDIKESDPLAFLTVLNLHTHRDLPAIRPLSAYLSTKAASIPSLSNTLPSLLSSANSSQVGLLLSSRLLNMPSAIVPPLYNMLLEEIAWAVEESEPYAFTHYLLLSKTYEEIDSKLDEEQTRPQKKKKAGSEKKETFYFHPEDEVLQRYAVGYGSFDFEKQSYEGSSDARRTFQEAGIKPMGHLVLLEKDRLEEAVKAVGEYMGQAA